jgi:hypothetical protein
MLRKPLFFEGVLMKTKGCFFSKILQTKKPQGLLTN